MSFLWTAPLFAMSISGIAWYIFFLEPLDKALVDLETGIPNEKTL